MMERHIRMMMAGRLRLLLLSVLSAWSLLLALGSTAQADFGIEPGSLKLKTTTGSGSPLTQAGAHADFTTEFRINKIGSTPAVSGDLKKVDVELPHGLLANATITPKCSVAVLVITGLCPADTRVGTINATVYDPVFHSEGVYSPEPLYNAEPIEGEPAAFVGEPASFPVRIDTNVGPEDGYRVHSTSDLLPELSPVSSITVTLFGIPFDHTGVGARKSLMMNPTECGTEPGGRVTVASWEHPETVVSMDAQLEPMTGCEKLLFNPTIEVQPQNGVAGTPSGYVIDVNVPQSQDADKPATPTVRDVTLSLPSGIALSPSVAHGLAGCTDNQVQIDSSTPVACPESSNIGSVEITSPLLEHPLAGSVYVGQPVPGNRYRIFLVVEEGKIVIKLEGKVRLNPQTGQISTSFLDNPDLPFSNLHMTLKGGPDAALVNPETCGPKTATSTITSSAGNTASPSSVFTISGNCSVGAFKPKLEAGAANPIGGSYSPFVLRVSREDGTAQLGSITATLPKGLLGKLAGIPYCSNVALASIPTAPETGAAQLANPSCPAASRVGTTVTAAGAGSDPFDIDDAPVYLAGPYKGAPLSLAVVTPAVAGPFDLGNVVTRVAMRVDPVTTQITAVSDPLPSILDGVPLNLRTIEVRIDKPEFTVNPTNCDPTAITSTIASLSGALASPSSRFQVGNCEGLALKPKLAVNFSGAPTRRGGHPKLTATLTTKKGESNLKQVQVTLPKTEFLDNAHIRTVCTRVQYAANNCPKASIYGHAKAWTPLLDKPLEGPVYLRSSNHTLPDLVASLDGQIHVDLDGRISSVEARIRNTFEAVPDAPVTKFQLTMQGGAKGLLVNNTQLCKASPKANVVFDGQNGKTEEANPAVSIGGCGSTGKKKSKKN
jgi:hypothetical protein